VSPPPARGAGGKQPRRSRRVKKLAPLAPLLGQPALSCAAPCTRGNPISTRENVDPLDPLAAAPEAIAGQPVPPGPPPHAGGTSASATSTPGTGHFEGAKRAFSRRRSEKAGCGSRWGTILSRPCRVGRPFIEPFSETLTQPHSNRE